MNRGIARRAIFEREDDFRMFRSLLAKGVRRYGVRVHAWTLLTNHFHLLIEPTRGDLSTFMQFVQSHYVLYFNGSRDRDGGLMRSRFPAKLVEDYGYWRALIRYIDWNPVRAGLCTRPWEHPHGSAHAYVRRRRGPVWLFRREVERTSCELSGTRLFCATAYREAFTPLSQPVEDVVKATLGGRRGRSQSTNLATASEVVHGQFDERAEMADGSPRTGIPASADHVLEACEQLDASQWPCLSRPGSIQVLAIGLLRDECGLKIRHVGAITGCKQTTVHRKAKQHRARLGLDPEYLRLTTEIVQRCRHRLRG